MSTNKRITINPSLFKAGWKSKTKKARTPTEIPIISPNILKNKLISRIKEHKNREATTLETTSFSQKPMLVDQSLFDFNSEFNNSINYLQTISKQKKVEEEKSDYDRKKKELYRKTLKNTNTFQPFVNVELHDDLKEPVNERTINNNHVANYTIRNNGPVTQQNHTLKLRPNNSVPYGNLKNGSKPTYREWVNKPVSTPVDNERERKLNALKEKIKQQKQIEHQKQFEQQKQLLKDVNKPEVREPEFKPTNNLIRPADSHSSWSMTDKEINHSPEGADLNLQRFTPFLFDRSAYNAHSGAFSSAKSNGSMHIFDAQRCKQQEVKQPTTRLTKRTIRKQHTIGKSKLKNTVSVLLKNNVTRKNIIVAQKELKQKPINEVKTYLREHNLIKGGSNATNHLLREMYESSMMAGKIQNNNKDTMLHNFMTGQE